MLQFSDPCLWDLEPTQIDEQADVWRNSPYLQDFALFEAAAQGKKKEKHLKHLFEHFALGCLTEHLSQTTALSGQCMGTLA